MDNRVKSMEHQVGVFPWPGHEGEDPEQQTEPDNKLLTIFPPGTGGQWWWGRKCPLQFTRKL